MWNRLPTCPFVCWPLSLPQGLWHLAYSSFVSQVLLSSWVTSRPMQILHLGYSSSLTPISLCLYVKSPTPIDMRQVLWSIIFSSYSRWWLSSLLPFISQSLKRVAFNPLFNPSIWFHHFTKMSMSRSPVSSSPINFIL